jgi:hypothetical protein
VAGDATHVLVGANGAVYVAPTTTAAPTGITSSLASWYDLGHISEDGIQFDDVRVAVSIVRMLARRPTREIVREQETTLTFDLKQWDWFNVLFSFGGGTLKSIGGNQYKFTPPADNAPPYERSLIVDWADGSRRYRLYVPRGTSVAAARTVLTLGNESDLPVQLTAFGDPPWTLFTNDPDFLSPTLRNQSVDAVVSKAGLTRTQSVDAIVLRTFTRTQSVDAVIKPDIWNIPATHAPGPLLLAPAMGPPVLARQGFPLIGIPPITRTQSADALVQATLTRTQSADALILKTIFRAQSADAIVSKAGLTRAQSADAFVQSTFTRVQSADAFVIQGWGSPWGTSPWGNMNEVPFLAPVRPSVTIGALRRFGPPVLVQQTFPYYARTFSVAQSADAVVYNPWPEVQPISRIPIAGILKWFGPPVLMQQTFPRYASTLSQSADAFIQVTKSLTQSADALVQPIKTHSVDAVIADTAVKNQPAPLIMPQTWKPRVTTY